MSLALHRLQEIIEVIKSYYDKAGENMSRPQSVIDAIDAQEKKFGSCGRTLEDWLRKEFSHLCVENITDWNYSTCFAFALRFHSPRKHYPISRQGYMGRLNDCGGELYSIGLNISVLHPVFVAYIVHDRLIGNDEVEISWSESSDNNEVAENLTSLIERVTGMGYTFLDEDDIATPVPGVTLELAKSDQVNLYTCLFVDQDQIFPFPHTVRRRL